MNHRVVLFHLREAKEELDGAISDIERNSEYDVGEFVVAMSHLYHHLNTAWNGRDQSDEMHQKASPEDFSRLRKFPANDELLLI